MMARRGMSSFLIVVALATSTLAMDDGGGRSVFATGAGNRALAMGSAYSAVADDASATIWNPGGLGRLTRRESQATQTTLFGLGFNEQYASVVLPHWRWGTVSFTWRRFGVDGIEQRDNSGFLLAGDLEDTETELSLGYGRSLLDGDLSLGGAFKIQRQSLAGYAGSGFGLDLGLWTRPLALAGLDGGFARDLSLGLAARNLIEPAIKLDQDNVPDPTALRTGLAWAHDLTAGIHLLAALDLEKTRDMDSRLHVGGEVGIHDVLALRLGAADGDFTAGLGLTWRSLGVDYQYEQNPLGDIHRFGLTVRFGQTVDETRAAEHAAAEAAAQHRLQAAFTAQNQAREEQLLDEAQTALDRGRWNDALSAVGTLSVLAPDRPELPALTAAAHAGLARQQENTGDLTGAALAWRRALAAVPGDPDALLGLARVQAESDRLSARSREINARYEAALDAFARDDLATARDGFAAVLELSPEDRDAATMLARAEAALTRRATALGEDAVNLAQASQFSAARKRLETARRLDPGAPGLAAATAELDRLASVAASAASQPQPTAPAIIAAPSLSPERRRELDDFYQRGLRAMQAGQRDEAVRYWELVWAADPEHEQVRENLTQEYLARGMEDYVGGALKPAVSSWEQALRIDPDDSRARGYLERARQQLSRMEKISSSR